MNLDVGPTQTVKVSLQLSLKLLVIYGLYDLLNFVDDFLHRACSNGAELYNISI